MATITVLAERIHAARRRANLNQDELAEVVGVSRQLVSRWERGGSVPDVVELVRIAHATRYPVTALLEAVEIDLTLPSGESDQARSGSGWCRVTPDQLQFAGLESVGHFDDEPIDLTDAADPRRMVTPGVTSGARRQGRAAA